jgi:guanyl-specific ribonuclease Sa
MRHRRLAKTLCAMAGSALALAAAPAAAATQTAATQTAATQAAATQTAATQATGARAAGSSGPMPNLPYNACNDTSLPTDYGTNFPTPNDPYGFGYYNQTAIGWEGNWYAPFAYLSGSYFARGVPATYTDQSGTRYCGAMYSFGVYTYGLNKDQAPPAQSETWNEADGYLPALTTSFTRNNIHITITDFADKQTIAGNPVELVYTRITVHNGTSAAADVPPDATGPNLVELDASPETVPAKATVTHDFVAAVDAFGGKLPTITRREAAPYDEAYHHMASYWNERLSAIPRLSLPNVGLPDTNNLKNPGAAMDNAYRAAFVYTRIVQSGDAPFSGANNYDWLLNHDLPGILDNRFELGDFKDARNLLLTGRTSEVSNFDEKGANWYWDGPWRTPLAWAEYLLQTNDVGFVKTYFDDNDTTSLYALMHTDYLSQLDKSTGYLGYSYDNDSGGVWLFDDETALAGLASYRYIAARIGDAAEAKWADGAYNSLLAAVNNGLKANNAGYLPCEVNEPFSSDRCGTANDANWASQVLWGENTWDVLLSGGTLNGILGDPSETDNVYQTGYSRLAGTGVPFPSFGAYDGYSVALNTAYANGALYGDAYRDLPIISYAWQIASTTGGPNAWWEANGSAPSNSNPWIGSHAAPEFGAVPYAWPMAGQTQSLLQSLAATGLVATGDGSTASDYHTALYIGRGVPDQWIADGQTIAVSGITSSDQNDVRETYGVRISTRDRVVTVTLTGRLPGDDVRIQLPVFAEAGVASVRGGRYDATTHTVYPAGRSVSIVLGDSARPAVAVTTTSTATGTHTQPLLIDGLTSHTTASFRNTGHTTLRNVAVTLNAPSGWTVAATSGTGFSSVAPGQTVTSTWDVTPTAKADGGYGLVASASYEAPEAASGTASAEQWTRAQPQFPLPAGTSDVALSATATASYGSPWTSVSAVNDGIYPPRSYDTADPYWGTWPEQGTQWLQLAWTSARAFSGASVYFWSDGSGVMPPASWKIQYLTSAGTWADVTGASSYGVALNQFNTVTFDPVSTTELRAVFDTGYTGTCTGSCHAVGVLQWVAAGS